MGSTTISFTKMEGLGNDYIYIDETRFPIDNPGELAIRLSDRHRGIGGDGIILIGPSNVADFRMRMFNADGSEGLMCGNGARCVGKYLYDKHLTRRTDISLETLSGIRKLKLHLGQDGQVQTVTVEMGSYSLSGAPHTLYACGRDFSGTGILIGNPHYVIFTDDAESLDLTLYGPAIENDPAFPNRTNVEFAKVLSDGTIRMRVWERGSGITLACGTGACATAAAAVELGLAKDSCKVVMDGGILAIDCDLVERKVVMTGPAVTVFEGSIDLSR